MHISELFIIVIVAVISGWFSYSEGRAKGRLDGVRESFHPFVDEGFFDGWRARHYGNPLQDNRVHPDEMKRLMPTVFDPAQELSDWMFNASHLSFEEYRAQKVAKLNAELETEQQLKNQRFKTQGQ